MVLAEASGKVCFAQSSPILQSPKTNKRDARLFVTFRPGEKIANEISTTAGYEFNKNNTCLLYTSPSPRDRTRSRMPSSA